MTRCALYRHFDADDRLLYVGISIRPGIRFAEHMASSAWASQIASMTLEWFSERDEAEQAERAAIATEKPAHNRSHANEGISAVADILAQWPSRVVIAAELGISPPVAHSWFQRGSVPPKYWRKLLDSAKRHGIDLTAEELVDAHHEATQ